MFRHLYLLLGVWPLHLLWVVALPLHQFLGVCLSTFYGRGYPSFWRSYGASDAPIWGIIPVWVAGGFGLPSIPAPGALRAGWGSRAPPFLLGRWGPSRTLPCFCWWAPQLAPFWEWGREWGRWQQGLVLWTLICHAKRPAGRVPPVGRAWLA